MNVIIVMLDTLRPDHVGCYGNKWIKTPNLDALARESMVFDRAVPESLATLQVRRALFTGMRVFPFTKEFFASTREALAAGATFLGVPQALAPGWEPIPWDLETLAEMVLRTPVPGTKGNGYRTALITDTAPYFSSPAMNYQRGFAHYDIIRGHETDCYGVPVLANRWDMKRFIPPWFEDAWEAGLLRHYLANTAKWEGEEDRFGPRTFKAAIQWLEDSREATDPFFLCVDEWDPHEPFDPPQEYVDLYDPGYKGIEMITPYYGPTKLMSEKELNHMRALYAGKVTMVDTWFGKFMDKVRELDLLDNTLLIVTSDHGHQLGEHGVSGKVPQGLFNELMDCVLMIRHPRGIGAGRRSNALVNHNDLCATVVNFLDIKPPYELDGKDLMPIVEGKQAEVRDYATCGASVWVWCCDDKYVLFCRNTGDLPRLFDMKNDPEQCHNIALDKPEIVRRMFDLILADAQGGPILPNWERSWFETGREAETLAAITSATSLQT